MNLGNFIDMRPNITKDTAPLFAREPREYLSEDAESLCRRSNIYLVECADSAQE